VASLRGAQSPGANAALRRVIFLGGTYVRERTKRLRIPCGAL
jgi:hypothetical protein